MFGAVAMDSGVQIRNPQTIYGGAAFSSQAALLLVDGGEQPRFFSSLFPETSVLPGEAVITAASGNVITGINNKNALDFLRELGIARSGLTDMFSALPLVIDRDGEQEVAFIHQIRTDGSLLCGRNVRTGSLLRLGCATADYVLESAASVACAVTQESRKRNGLIMCSCFSRLTALGGNPMAEIERVRSVRSGAAEPWLFFYSGGELCPRRVPSGETENRFHQNALIACAL
jgi:hypothetical protein